MLYSSISACIIKWQYGHSWQKERFPAQFYFYINHRQLLTGRYLAKIYGWVKIHMYMYIGVWVCFPWGASQRKSCVACSSSKISKDPYRVGWINENCTLPTHDFLYALICQIHTKNWTFKKRFPFHTFYEMVGFNPPFCVYTLPHPPFPTPLSTHKFGRAGYSTFSLTCLPGVRFQGLVDLGVMGIYFALVHAQKKQRIF